MAKLLVRRLTRSDPPGKSGIATAQFLCRRSPYLGRSFQIRRETRKRFRSPLNRTDRGRRPPTPTRFDRQYCNSAPPSAPGHGRSRRQKRGALAQLRKDLLRGTRAIKASNGVSALTSACRGHGSDPASAAGRSEPPSARQVREQAPQNTTCRREPQLLHSASIADMRGRSVCSSRSVPGRRRGAAHILEPVAILLRNILFERAPDRHAS